MRAWTSLESAGFERSTTCNYRSSNDYSQLLQQSCAYKILLLVDLGYAQNSQNQESQNLRQMHVLNSHVMLYRLSALPPLLLSPVRKPERLTTREGANWMGVASRQNEVWGLGASSIPAMVVR